MRNLLWSLVLVLIAAGICSAQTTLYFPQFVDGRDTGSTAAWGTLLVITNPAALGTPAASVTITLTNDNGTPMNRTFIDITGTPVGNTFQIAGGQTQLLASPSNGQPLTPQNSGFATVTSNLPVNAALIFIEYVCLANDGCGNPISEAGVSSAVPLTRQAVPIFQNSNPRPGTYGNNDALAVANPGTATATITFQLFDPTGNAIGSPVTQTLAAMNHTAFFIPQLFPSAPPAFGGTMRITSDNPIVTTGLVFTGPGLFATIPVFPLP